MQIGWGSRTRTYTSDDVSWFKVRRVSNYTMPQCSFLWQFEQRHLHLAISAKMRSFDHPFFTAIATSKSFCVGSVWWNSNVATWFSGHKSHFNVVLSSANHLRSSSRRAYICSRRADLFFLYHFLWYPCWYFCSSFIPISRYLKHQKLFKLCLPTGLTVLWWPTIITVLKLVATLGIEPSTLPLSRACSSYYELGSDMIEWMELNHRLERNHAFTVSFTIIVRSGLPLNYIQSKLVVLRGIEPRSFAYRATALPLSYRTLAHTFLLSIVGHEGWNLCYLSERFAVCITKWQEWRVLPPLSFPWQGNESAVPLHPYKLADITGIEPA